MASLPEEEEEEVRFRPAKKPWIGALVDMSVAKEDEIALEEETERAQSELPTTATRALRCCWRMPLFASSTTFPRPEPGPIPICEPLDFLQHRRLQEEHRRALLPGHFEQLAIDRQLVMDCLRHYNSTHPGDEYQPAPGQVTQNYRFEEGTCWTHGNFVARRKRSGCFSFLPAPRTIFFFELASRNDFDGVGTCTPLVDCICKTCDRRLDVWRPDLNRTFACSHGEVEKVCTMCFSCCDVLHPPPAEFAFRGNDDATSH